MFHGYRPKGEMIRIVTSSYSDRETGEITLAACNQALHREYENLIWNRIMLGWEKLSTDL